MTPDARDRTVKHFMNNVGVQVFLVSLKAGGVALNLTEASVRPLLDDRLIARALMVACRESSSWTLGGIRR